MSRPKRSLIVMTSHADMGVRRKKTGNWFDEGGDRVLRVSRGGLPGSAELSSGWIGTARSSEWALAVHDRGHRPVPRGPAAMPELKEMASLSYRSFDGCLFPGGYEQLWDLASDSSSLKMIEESLSAGRPVAMVCHAPAILRDAKGANRLRFALPDKATADRPRTLHRVAGDGRAGPRRGSPVTRRVQSVRVTRYEPKAEGVVSMSNTCRRRAELQ